MFHITQKSDTVFLQLGDENVRIPISVILLLAIIISFMGLVPAALCMPRLIFQIPPVKSLLCLDVNGDGPVNAGDLLVVGRSLGTSRGSVNWNPEADVNQDGVINIFAVVQIATVVGRDV